MGQIRRVLAGPSTLRQVWAIKLRVQGMTCDHCVRAITLAVSQVPGVRSVSVDLKSGEVTIDGAPDTMAAQHAIEGEGYSVLT